MSRRKILLTGPSGTLGRNFLELVGQDSGHQILALLRGPSRFQNRFSSVEEVRADLSDRRKIAGIVSGFCPEFIVHCAATGMEFPKTEWFDLIRFNVDFTVNLCECAAGARGAHFIFIGTGLAYRPQPRPLVEEDAIDTPHPYGASKAAADLLIRSAAVEFGLPLTVLRPFSFTGLGDDRKRLFPSLLRAVAAVAKHQRNFAGLSVLIDDYRLCWSCPNTYPTPSFYVQWAEKNHLSWTIEQDIFVARSPHLPLY
jgi:nucleoside-diphosphate-sugar epimerase